MTKTDLAKPDLRKTITPSAQGEPVNIEIKKSLKDLASDRLKALIDEETRIVRGRFRCIQNPGSIETITVRKYKGIPPFSKKMTDNCVYDVPLYVARHLQGIDKVAGELKGVLNTCSQAVHGFKLSSENSNPNIEMNAKKTVPILFKRRYTFESLEFENI